MKLKHILVVLFVAFCKTELSQAQCKPKDVMVVVELSATDRSSAYFTTLFMPKLKNKLKPTKECLSVGFIFVWKIAESVINLKCDHVRCYRQGQRKAEGIIRRSVRSQGPYDSNEVVKGINMAVKELLPDGVDPKNQREKILVLLLSRPPNADIINTATDYLDYNVKILAVSVGDGAADHLGAISSSEDYELKLNSFKQLALNGASKISDLVNPPPLTAKLAAPSYDAASAKDEAQSSTLVEDAKDTCKNIVDIAFIVDSSGSVGKYYEDEKFFVKRIATRFKIIEQGTHGGVVLFSSHGYIRTEIKFTEFLTTNTFNDAVQNLPFYGYMTRIDKALELAHTELYTEKGKTRPYVKKLLFLITDGKQNPDQIGGSPLNPSTQAEKLHRSNVQVYAVGVGSKVNITELEGITKDPKKVFRVSDFKQLIGNAFVQNVSKQLCDGVVKTTIEPPSKIADKKCNETSCGCGCCGKKPVYVNIFQSSNNYVNQGQEVVQSGSGNNAGVTGKPDNVPSKDMVKTLSDKEVFDYIKTLLPYYDSMNQSLKELLARAVKNKNRNPVSKK